MLMSLALDSLPPLHHCPLPAAQGSPHFVRHSTQSMLFCKSTTVMTAVLNHYMTLNTTGTISSSVKTDNICFVQIYCIASYKVTNTKQSPKQRTLLLQNVMPDGCTMLRDPVKVQNRELFFCRM